jgi:hypothetical protein
MTYYVRFMGYNRWPVPTFQPLGPNTVQQEPPQLEQEKVSRINLLNLPTDANT